jgi:acetylornithine deacetylase/succinyl-diaminopimelate desuccinylase-like protein
MEVTRIPAPPFGEAARADWLAARFRELGLDDVHIDGIGNVVGLRPGLHPPTDPRYVAITAHIDTVFPAGTGVSVRREGNRLYGPGISDNSAGITALLALAGALRHAEIRTESPLVFIGNVGEEGEGDVRGMRYLFADPRWRDAIAATLVLDGAGTDTIVTEALGSKRFLVTILGPGGHSWSDFGTANPIVVLARAIDQFARTPVPASPKTTFNIGVITGGTSVNSIPESASIKVDIRSAAGEQVERLERALRDAVERAVASEPGANSGGRSNSGLVADIKLIGSRPAARLNADSPMLAVVQAVDIHLDNNARLQRASTDANIPLSQGRDAIAIGAGGAGGGAHTLHEWYDPTGRDLGLRRILLTVLTVAGVQE